jgi:hypothetical protein
MKLNRSVALITIFSWLLPIAATAGDLILTGPGNKRQLTFSTQDKPGWVKVTAANGKSRDLSPDDLLQMKKVMESRINDPQADRRSHQKTAYIIFGSVMAASIGIVSLAHADDFKNGCIAAFRENPNIPFQMGFLGGLVAFSAATPVFIISFFQGYSEKDVEDFRKLHDAEFLETGSRTVFLTKNGLTEIAKLVFPKTKRGGGGWEPGAPGNRFSPADRVLDNATGVPTF